MNVLITSGGTSEKIDAVRSISNMSTGTLGSILALKYAELPDVENIFYICSNSAVKPHDGKVKIIIADNVSSLEIAIKELLNNARIDIIVHSMAVSDYRVKSVTSLKNPELKINRDDKIDSDTGDIILILERTPKIISLFQSLSPKATLVGFKLLDNVPLETLIDNGFRILTENKCSFVFANDLKDIDKEKHTGYLIDRNKNYTQYTGKANIADAIVTATVNERKNGL